LVKIRLYLSPRRVRTVLGTRVTRSHSPKTDEASIKDRNILIV